MRIKVDKVKLAGEVRNALAEMEAASEAYLDAYGKFIEADESLKAKKSEAVTLAEGKTASIRQAKATLMIARDLVSRARAKIKLEQTDVERDTARLKYRVLSSVLAASGGEPLLYPIEDRIPDPLKEINKAYEELVQADRELSEAIEDYITKDTEYELKKAQKVALGLPGKNEDERKANLYKDPEIIAAREALSEAKIKYENAWVMRQIARDRLKFWLTYVRSLGLDEGNVDDPGRIERR